jgi:hypothetical protein
MQQFIGKYRDHINGVLSGFDRLVFRRPSAGSFDCCGHTDSSRTSHPPLSSHRGWAQHPHRCSDNSQRQRSSTESTSESGITKSSRPAKKQRFSSTERPLGARPSYLQARGHWRTTRAGVA